MNRDYHDGLMEQLLREILGGDRPRDMTARVLAQAKIYDRFRRRWWIAAGAAVAASVVLAASLAMKSTAWRLPTAMKRSLGRRFRPMTSTPATFAWAGTSM